MLRSEFREAVTHCLLAEWLELAGRTVEVSCPGEIQQKITFDNKGTRNMIILRQSHIEFCPSPPVAKRIGFFQFDYSEKQNQDFRKICAPILTLNPFSVVHENLSHLKCLLAYRGCRAKNGMSRMAVNHNFSGRYTGLEIREKS